MRRGPPPLWLLVFITLSGTLAIHVFMPALPLAARDLQTSAGAMQATIGVYIFGLAVGQPIYGPLSDCYGRRPVLLAGLTLFTIGGLWSLWAPSVQMLFVARFVQALGGCAGLVLGRAIVRDTSDLSGTMQRLALISMVTLIGPGLAPLLGQAVLTHVGWRAIFALLALLGAVNLLLTALLLEETAVPTGRLAIGPLLHSQRELLGSRKFVGLAFGGAGATTATYSFFAAAPFIFVEQLHRPLDHVGMYLATMIFAAALGNALVARMVARRGIRRVILRANLLGIGSVALLGASILGGFFGWQLTLGAMATFTFVAGLISPIAMAQALDTDPRHVGAAAGSYGAIQMGVGALCTWLVGLGADPARSVTVVLLTAALISQLAFRATLPGAAERGPR